MNDGQKNINPWAEKLQDISLPEETMMWEGMSAMLDNELPQVVKKDYRRWALLIILLLLLLGVCNCPTGWRNGYKSDTTITNKSGNEITENKLDSDKRNADKAVANGKEKRVANSNNNVGIDSANTRLNVNKTNGDSAVGSEKSKLRLKENDTVSNNKRFTPTVTNSIQKRVTNNNRKATAIAKNPTDQISNNQQKIAGNSKGKTRFQVKAGSTKTGNVDDSQNDLSGTSDVTINGTKKSRGKEKKRIKTKVGSIITKPSDDQLEYENPKSNDSQKKIVTNKTISTIDSIAGTDSAALNARRSSQQKPLKDSSQIFDSLNKNVAIAKKDSLQKDSVASAKKKKEKENDKVQGWAAGVGVNHFFPISGQERSTLNSDGLSGSWKDYLPVPQIRYYFSKNLYTQLEAQFNAPQYTQNVLGRFVPPDSFGITTQTSVYVKKLFYFNLPLSVHYSPLKNLYLGAGVQFSRLGNAVGTVETKNYRGSIPDSSAVDIKTQSLKTDSVYQRISTNEFRWLVDANYHWKNFTLGARYNQAFSNFINVQVSSTQFTQARNSSLQLYLRYTFWRSRKLKKANVY